MENIQYVTIIHWLKRKKIAKLWVQLHFKYMNNMDGCVKLTVDTHCALYE